MQSSLAEDLWAVPLDLWSELRALPPWLAVLIVVGLSLVAARVIQVGGDVLIRRLTRRIPTDVDAAVLRSIHPALYVTVVLVGANLGVLLVTDAPEWTGPMEASTLTLIALVWAFQLARMGRRVAAEFTGEKGDAARVAPIFQNVWSAVLLGVTGFFVLSLWNIDVTPLLASAGILGIVIGFAARDTIANFFGSIALYADGTYVVGDYIVLESGERGRVEDISIRSTVLRTRDDMLVTVPNSVLNTATIINESSPQRERRVRVSVGVAYGSDIDEVEDTLLEVADAESIVLDSPAPRVRFRGFGDSALDVELLCWIPAPVMRGRATHRLNKGVYRAFTDAGIEIPYPQRVVTMNPEHGAPDDASEAAETLADGAQSEAADD